MTRRSAGWWLARDQHHLRRSTVAIVLILVGLGLLWLSTALLMHFARGTLEKVAPPMP